jgi:archaellin
MNRTEKSQDINEDASIGIGAMIVFIALILVAAVASAVIIQTAEKLQQTAQQTGADTEAEQGSKIVLLSAIISNSAGNVIIITYELGAGSETVAETAVSWMVVGDAGGATLVMDSGDFTATTTLGGAVKATATLIPGNAYELPITMDDNTLIASSSYQLVIGVTGGGITYETLSTGLSIANGEMVI